MEVIDEFDVEELLDQIKALAKAIGAILLDGAHIDKEDVGVLAYMIVYLARQVEKKIEAEEDTPKPQAAGPGKAEKEAA